MPEEEWPGKVRAGMSRHSAPHVTRMEVAGLMAGGCFHGGAVPVCLIRPSKQLEQQALNISMEKFRPPPDLFWTGSSHL